MEQDPVFTKAFSPVKKAWLPKIFSGVPPFPGIIPQMGINFLCFLSSTNLSGHVNGFPQCREGYLREK